MEEGKLLGIGNPLLDLTVNGDKALLEKYHLEENNAIIGEEIHKPLYNELMENYSVQFTAGGSVQNSLRVCQWILKKPKVCVFMGSVGKDKYSEILKQRAEADGVEVKYQYQEDVPTGTCAVIVTQHQGSKRSLCANLGAAERFTIDHIRRPENHEFIKKAEFFYVSGFFITVCFETMIDVAQHAASEKRTFITNLSAPFICQHFKKPLLDVMPYVDIVFGNETEALTFSKEMDFGTTDLKVIALRIMNLPKKNPARNRVVIITQGHFPVLATIGGVVKEIPVPDVPKARIMDTNGAGDAFVGGYLSQLIQGKSIEESIDCAIWAAAHVIQHSGCCFDVKVSYNS